MGDREPREPRDGLDPVGPFHPYLVYAFILLLDLIGAALIVMAVVWASDQAEDLLWPGGEEWVDF
ncbi:MAG TPA: hypothetical protein VFO69_12310 [Allosphingosinicella sp.]|nr:hypothetical protein [Allosphingosinicella sp.]